jgi:hypothetical protein
MSVPTGLPPIDTPPEPSGGLNPLPSGARHRRAIILLSLIGGVALFAAVGIALYRHTDEPAVTTTNAALSNPAYPLQGHWQQTEQGQIIVCDPSSVQAWTDGYHTVAINVDLGVPGVVDVWIAGNELNGNLPFHLAQQVTVRGTDAQFTTWAADPGEWVHVRANNKHVTGACDVVPRLR